SLPRATHSPYPTLFRPEQLMAEIEDATVRISSLVGAARQYSQLDRAPFRPVDLHELLDSTLTMLDQVLAGVEVVRHYDPTLPPRSEEHTSELQSRENLV